MSGVESDEVEDISCPKVVEMYAKASSIANRALQHVLSLIKVDADVYDLCVAGDTFIHDSLSKVYTKKIVLAPGEAKEIMPKGTAFPTCISINEIVGHFSPLKSDSVKIKAGDVVKVDLGVHIHGYVVMAAHTFVVPDATTITDKRADVVRCAYEAAQVAIRLVRVGKTNHDITKAVTAICDDYNCNPVVGIISHELTRYCLDGEKIIVNKDYSKQGWTRPVEMFEFNINEVYSLDIVVTTAADPRSKACDNRTTVFKRNSAPSRDLSTAKSRSFLEEVEEKYHDMAFSLNMFQDEIGARIGSNEAKRHQLLDEFPVTRCAHQELVAQFKCTVMITSRGTKKAAGLLAMSEEQKVLLSSSKAISNDEIIDLLKSSEESFVKDVSEKSLSPKAPKVKENKK